MGNIKTKASLVDNYTVNNVARNHKWLVDEPADLGGKDLGPKPSEKLLSALASCMIITVHMYAKRKGWELEDMEVELEIIEISEVTRIKKSVTIKGELSREQEMRMIEISSRCPVAKMLANSIEFVE